MGYKIKSVLFFSLLIFYISIFIYCGREINIYFLLVSLFLTLSPVYYFMTRGANRIEFLLAYTKEKRDLINYCEDQYIEQFKMIVEQHFPTKLKLEQLRLLQGATIILHAVANDSPNIIKYLLDEKKYDVNLQSKNNETALMRAIVINKPNIVKLLLSYKPNLELVNQMNLNAIELAIYRKKPNLIKMIFENGGKFNLHSYIEKSNTINLTKWENVDPKVKKVILFESVFQRKKLFYHLYELQKQGESSLPHCSRLRNNLIQSIKNFV